MVLLGGFQAPDGQWDGHLASGEGVSGDTPSLMPPPNPPVILQMPELFGWPDPGT